MLVTTVASRWYSLSDYIWRIFSSSTYFLSQKTKLITNIEKLTFWIGDNDKLHYAKEELLLQIDNLDISINSNDFFIVDRKFLAGVSVVQIYSNEEYITHELMPEIIFFNRSFRLFVALTL